MSPSLRPPAGRLPAPSATRAVPGMEEPTFSVSPFSTPPPSPPPTTAAVTNKFVLLGLSDGSLTLYDVFGNLVDRHTAVHSTAVTAVSLAADASQNDVLASAAGTHLRVARLCTTNGAILSDAKPYFTRTTPAPVTALAVDPNFGRPRYGQRVAYATHDGRVVVFTSAWFGGGDTVVHPPSSSPVVALAWRHHLLTYAVRDGVRVHDTRADRLVCVVAQPASGPRASPPPSPTESFPSSSNPESLSSSPRQQHVQNGAPVKTPSSWAPRTKLFMEENSAAPVSPHNEPTILLYVVWPSGASIIQIGPHKDLLQTENVPLRDVHVVFRIQRDSLPHNGLTQHDIAQLPGKTGTFVQHSPLLSMMPFGNDEIAVLLGTPSRALVMHLVDMNGVSLKSMSMPHSELRDADMLAIPGGDPLALIIGHKADCVSPSEATDDNSLTPDNLVYVRSRTTAERVKWLLGQSRFSDALQIAQSAPGGSLRRAEVSIEDVGEQFLESLYEAGDYQHLAAVLQETIATTTPYTGFRAREKVLVKRKRRWERWINVFRKGDKLSTVATSIPTYEPCLDKDTYNGVLIELCSDDPSVMLHALKTWPADVFSVSTLTKAIEERLSQTGGNEGKTEEGRESLREGLLMMYGLSGRHDETLNLLLREGSPKVYDYIKSHHLYEAVRSQETITGLYKVDATAATEILAHAPETVLPPEAVVPILVKADNSKWTFMYLHAVFKIDPDHAPKYHNQLLKLYVEHGSPGMLYHFMKTSTHYSLDRALQEMGGPKGLKPGHLARERVYVLAAMGDLNSAMDILLDELGDTFAAIEFASDHGDTVLWERLIEHAGDHADTLAALLDSPAGGKVDPVRLIPLLNSEMKIPRLRDRLHRILVDAALERALREDVTAVLHYEASQLLSELEECVSTRPGLS